MYDLDKNHLYESCQAITNAFYLKVVRCVIQSFGFGKTGSPETDLKAGVLCIDEISMSLHYASNPPLECGSPSIFLRWCMMDPLSNRYDYAVQALYDLLVKWFLYSRTLSLGKASFFPHGLREKYIGAVLPYIGRKFAGDKTLEFHEWSLLQCQIPYFYFNEENLWRKHPKSFIIRTCYLHT